MARRSLSDIRSAASDLDPARLDALSEDEIARQKAEEGFERGPDGAAQAVLPPAEIRGRLGMTQQAFARALRIPVATLRKWEDGRALPDPAARSLLNAVARAPDAVLTALGPSPAPRRPDHPVRTASATRS
ncbi:helix-turn-helix domain-containing protein [Methylobacterium sp. JK268]